MLKTSMAAPLASAAGDPGAPTINVKKMLTVGPLVGVDGDPRVPTINVKHIDDGPPGGC
jgi:hypothetical protein